MSTVDVVGGVGFMWIVTPATRRDLLSVLSTDYLKNILVCPLFDDDHNPDVYNMARRLKRERLASESRGIRFSVICEFVQSGIFVVHTEKDNFNVRGARKVHAVRQFFVMPPEADDPQTQNQLSTYLSIGLEG